MHQRPKPCNIYGECFVARAPCRPQAEFWSFGSLPESSERSDMSVKRALGGSKQVARGAEWICMCEKTGDRCKKNKNTCFTYRLVSPQPPQPDWVCFADLKRAESTIKHNEAHKQHMCSKLRQGPNQYIASFAKSWSAGFVGSLKHRMKLLTAWQVSSHSAANMIVIIITITIIIIIIIIIVIFVKSTLFFLHLAASISKTQLEVVASIIGNVHDLVILKVLAAMGKVRLYSMDWLREKS